MSQYKVILFDLDGTISDPKVGITKSVQYALKKMNIDEPDLDKLECFIGPPIQVSFPEFYHFNASETQRAIEYYRERFKEKGMFENEVCENGKIKRPVAPEQLKSMLMSLYFQEDSKKKLHDRLTKTMKSGRSGGEKNA